MSGNGMQTESQLAAAIVIRITTDGQIMPEFNGLDPSTAVVVLHKVLLGLVSQIDIGPKRLVVPAGIVPRPVTGGS